MQTPRNRLKGGVYKNMIEQICVKLFKDNYITCYIENGKVLASGYTTKLTRENYSSSFSKNVKKKIEDYSLGKKVDLQKISIKIPGQDFGKKVFSSVKKIPRGQTLTYKEVAIKSGKPFGARAVGNIMGKNSLPLFIPCHRVVSQTGLGGFMKGKKGGLEIKQTLLDLEQK